MSSSRARLADMDVFELLEVVLMAVSTVCVFAFNFDTEGFGNTLTNAVIIGFILAEAIACLFRRSYCVHPAVALFALFAWFCLCSILWSVTPAKSYSRVQSLLIMLVYYLALTNFALTRSETRARAVFLAKLLVFSSFFAAAYLLLSSDWQTGARVTGIIGDSNQASAYLSYVTPIALYCGAKGLLPRWVVALDIVMITFAVGVMGSRTGLFIVAAGIVLYWLIRSIQRGIISIRTVVSAVLIVAGVILLVNFIMTNEIAYEIVGERFESLLDILSGGSSKINENSYYERQALFNLAVELFKDHPIVGVGIDGYAYYASISIRDTFSHNDYMQLLSCVGVIGFALYYAQHVYIVSGFRSLSKAELAMCITLVVMMLAFHTTVVFYYQKLEFVFLSFLVGVVSAWQANSFESEGDGS